MIIVPRSATLLWVTPNALEQIDKATRTCYKSEGNYDPAKSEEFVRRVALQNHHESVIEHGVASVRVIGDRGDSHEFVRHRIASYSQESTRYCNYAKDKFGGQIQVVAPEDMPVEDMPYFVADMEAAERSYFRWLERGAPPQRARAVLPTCLKTEWVVTMNFRAWRNFLKLRTAKAAHPNIRAIANQIGNHLAREVPVLFADIMAEAVA